MFPPPHSFALSSASRRPALSFGLTTTASPPTRGVKVKHGGVSTTHGTVCGVSQEGGVGGEDLRINMWLLP